MRTIVWLCDWLPPDFGAVGQYIQLFAETHARDGGRAVVIGLTSGCDDQRTERIGTGERIEIRLHRPPVEKARLLRRAVWTLRTNVELVWHARHWLARADEIRLDGSPPLIEQFVLPLVPDAVRRVVFRISDLHPECLMAHLGRRPWVLRALQMMARFWRRRVGRLEVIGEDQRARLLADGVPADRIELRRTPSPVTILPNTTPTPTPPELAGRAVLLYSGNFGIAHEAETLIAGYAHHHTAGTGRVGLWLNATGVNADRVEAALREGNLPVARTTPVPLADLPALLVAPAAHLVTLRPAFAGLVVPSKIYACLESGRDILYVGPGTSDAWRLCHKGRDASAWRHVEPGNSNTLAAALEHIADRASRG